MTKRGREKGDQGLRTNNLITQRLYDPMTENNKAGFLKPKERYTNFFLYTLYFKKP